MRTEMQLASGKSSAGECAHEVLDVVPMIMRVIRAELRRYGTMEMSVPHFRTLLFLFNNKGASLSEVAEGYGPLKKKTFRIGNMGYIETKDIDLMLGALGDVLSSLS